MVGLNRFLTVCSQETLDVSALIVILFRPVLSVSEWAVHWIQTWNDNPRPYVWTKTADQILASIGNYCTRISDSGH
jgi:hypothetical protein